MTSAFTLPRFDDEDPPSPETQREAVARRLKESGAVDGAAFLRAEQAAIRTNQPVEQVLNQIGALSDDALVRAYEAVCGLPVWDPQSQPAQVDAKALGIAIEYLRRRRFLPLHEEEQTLVCAACDPLDAEGVAGLAFAADRSIKILIARPGEFRKAFGALHPDLADLAAPDERRLERDIDQLSELGVEGAGARLVATALDAAIARGASDIHFEPRRNDLRIRLRIDGRLVDFETASLDLAAPAVSRVKVIANLDLGEKRLPQDGRTSFVVQGRSIDVRVATSPTVFGESAVLRLLDRESVPLDLEALGITGEPAEVLRRASETAHGLFLISGPTGSGKTTTLYALLQRMRETDRKILSVEDPVEYHFEHVSQTQVSPQIGLTFASALRSFLRQDPDVILVGEIRDPETAAVAIQAAMTGHLVLASVHANDAAGVIPRLLDMGVEAFQLAAGLKGAAAQRLVRRLCVDCREPSKPTTAERETAKSLGATAPGQLYQPSGCAACGGTGFRGRIAIAEAFQVDEAALRRMMKADTERTQGHWRSMGADGVAKAELGLTTLEEVVSAIGE